MPEPTAALPEPTSGDEQRPVAEPTDGRARLAASLRRPGSRGQLVVAVLLALLGFAGVTQVRSTGRDDSYVGARQSDLIQYIDNLGLASQRAQSEIAKLEQTRTALGNDTQARRTALARAKEQASTLGILAGTLPAQGPGIRTTVTDRGTAVGTNQLIDGLQELRDAGAEVIELNDKVRVVASTSLQDTTGGGVLVDGTVLRPPYVIDAIGDPHTLASALDFAEGFISEVSGVGGSVRVKESQDISVLAVRTAKAPTYAVPDGTG